MTATFAFHGTGKKLHKNARCAGGAKHSYSQLTEEQAVAEVAKYGMGYCQKCWSV